MAVNVFCAHTLVPIFCLCSNRKYENICCICYPSKWLWHHPLATKPCNKNTQAQCHWGEKKKLYFISKLQQTQTKANYQPFCYQGKHFSFYYYPINLSNYSSFTLILAHRQLSLRTFIFMEQSAQSVCISVSIIMFLWRCCICNKVENGPACIGLPPTSSLKPTLISYQPTFMTFSHFELMQNNNSSLYTIKDYLTSSLINVTFTGAAYNFLFVISG